MTRMSWITQEEYENAIDESVVRERMEKMRRDGRQSSWVRGHLQYLTRAPEVSALPSPLAVHVSDMEACRRILENSENPQ